jgi:cytochrome c biogenesis factor
MFWFYMKIIYIYTNFFIAKLKSFFYVYYSMKLIHDYNKLIFYTITFLMLIGISVLLLMLIYSSFNYQINIKNIETLSPIWNFNIG